MSRVVDISLKLQKRHFAQRRPISKPEYDKLYYLHSWLKFRSVSDAAFEQDLRLHEKMRYDLNCLVCALPLLDFLRFIHLTAMSDHSNNTCNVHNMRADIRGDNKNCEELNPTSAIENQAVCFLLMVCID